MKSSNGYQYVMICGILSQAAAAAFFVLDPGKHEPIELIH